MRVWPFERTSREERFWRWFRDNSDRLFHFESNQERVFRDLTHALKRVHAGLTFEFGPVEGGRREFIVSADGIRDAFPAVRQLVEVAPSLPAWIVVPFRPPKSLEYAIELGEHRLGPDDVWFTAETDHGRIGLTLFIRGLSQDNEKGLGHAAFILLDNALGEYAVETQVGFVELKPLAPDDPTNARKPFRRIREVFDVVAH